ncbi:MAG: hypothetical protein AAF939_05240 [Planctomycetota bacterium]
MNALVYIVLSAVQQLGVIGHTVLQDSQPATGESNLSDQLKEHASEVGETLNQSEAIQNVSAGILEPIYQIGEYMTFSSFYWVAFSLMIAGVVCYAGQLFLAKFFLLFKGSLNIREIILDSFSLLVSAVGLVLVTQIATNHSTFTNHSVSVISSTAVGVIVGFVFYWWGQKTEFRAVDAGSKKLES